MLGGCLGIGLVASFDFVDLALMVCRISFALWLISLVLVLPLSSIWFIYLKQINVFFLDITTQLCN